MRDTKELTVEEIIKELDEIGERVKSEMDQVGVAIITACPSTILWMNQADRDRQHALKMEYQSRGEQLRIEARERILLRRRNRKLKK